MNVFTMCLFFFATIFDITIFSDRRVNFINNFERLSLKILRKRQEKKNLYFTQNLF